MKKITNEEYFCLVKKYLADPASNFMRFGQWFIVNYLDKNSPANPDLFYETNIIRAGMIIGEFYVEKDEK